MQKETIKTLIQFGNSKLPKTTMIFNMGTSKRCPSRTLGLCAVDGCCYAAKAEIQYHTTCPQFRNRQKLYWLTSTAEEIIRDLDSVLGRKRKLPKLFRFNEAGDFWSQACVDKLSKIALHLWDKYQITTYGYTARRDLDFSSVHFLVKGSSNEAGNNGKTMVVDSIEETPADFMLCPGSCKECSMCAVPNSLNIAFLRH